MALTPETVARAAQLFSDALGRDAGLCVDEWPIDLDALPEPTRPRVQGLLDAGQFRAASALAIWATANAAPPLEDDPCVLGTIEELLDAAADCAPSPKRRRSEIEELIDEELDEISWDESSRPASCVFPDATGCTPKRPLELFMTDANDEPTAIAIHPTKKYTESGAVKVRGPDGTWTRTLIRSEQRLGREVEFVVVSNGFGRVYATDVQPAHPPFEI